MENRGNRTSEELAEAQAKFRGLRASRRSNRNPTDSPVAPPEIEIGFEGNPDSFQPGDFLICEYFVHANKKHDISAIETSVIWLTEGKGEEDIGVHFFERRQKQSLPNEIFKHAQRISTVLPASPLSYEGGILKIRWGVRVRLFMGNGQQVTEDHYFRLGSVKPFEPAGDAPEEAESKAGGG